jgi:hypothetical protein
MVLIEPSDVRDHHTQRSKFRLGVSSGAKHFFDLRDVHLAVNQI